MKRFKVYMIVEAEDEGEAEEKFNNFSLEIIKDSVLFEDCEEE